MSYLQDAFQFASEIKENQEKLKRAVADYSTLLEILVRPSLTAEQNEHLTTALEQIVLVCSKCSFQIGYNTVLQRFAEGKALSTPPTFPQQ